MKTKTPREILFARGKTPDIRLGMKISTVLAMLEVMPKPLEP